MKKSLEHFWADAQSIVLRKEEKEHIAQKLGVRVREDVAQRPIERMNEKELFQAAGTVRLSPLERVRCRETIWERIEAQSIAWWLMPFKHLTSVIASLLIITLIGGVGATYASESAMPGDLLYPVKININEPMRKTLARTPKARAAFAAERAEARLHEAEMLSEQDDMDGAMSTMITANFEEHIADFEKQVTSLETEQNYDSIGLISMDLEASLRGHERLIARMNMKNDQAKDLLKMVKSARMKAEEIAINASMEGGTGDRSMVAAAKRQAESRLAEVQNVLGKMPHATEETREVFAQAQAALTKATTEDMHDADSLKLMRSALRKAREAAILASAHVVPSEQAEPTMMMLSADTDGDTNDQGEIHPPMMLMKATDEKQQQIPPQEFEEASDDITFSAAVHKKMTKKKLEKMRTKMAHDEMPLDSDAVQELSRGLVDTETLLTVSDAEMNTGNSANALDAAEKALQRADRMEKHLQKVSDERRGKRIR